MMFQVNSNAVVMNEKQISDERRVCVCNLICQNVSYVDE